MIISMKLRVVVLSLCLAARLASAQNLLQNPDFDTDLQGWSVFGLDGGGSVDWDSLDFEGNPLSGSMLAINQQPDKSLCSGMLQFINGLEGGTTYEFGGRAFILGGSGFELGALETVQLELQFRSGACPGTFIPPPHFVTAFEPQGGWILLSDTAVAPDDATCGLFAVSACKDRAGGQFSAHWDGLFLGPATIFADGFESGDTGAWSTTVP